MITKQETQRIISTAMANFAAGHNGAIGLDKDYIKNEVQSLGGTGKDFYTVMLTGYHRIMKEEEEES